MIFISYDASCFTTEMFIFRERQTLAQNYLSGKDQNPDLPNVDQVLTKSLTQVLTCLLVLSPKQPLGILRPCFLGRDWTSLIDGKYRIFFSLSLCFHTAFACFFPPLPFLFKKNIPILTVSFFFFFSFFQHIFFFPSSSEEGKWEWLWWSSNAQQGKTTTNTHTVLSIQTECLI